MTIFTGNTCNAAETKTVNVGGVPTLVTNFNIAENYAGYNGETATQYYRVNLWRDKGAKIAQYIGDKSRNLTVQGRVKGRGYLTQEIVDQIKAGADWRKLKIPCQLELTNPQITFNDANPNKVTEAMEAPKDLPFPEAE